MVLLMLVKRYVDTFLSKKRGYKELLLRYIFLNYRVLNIELCKITQTRISIPVILFLAEKIWLKRVL